MRDFHILPCELQGFPEMTYVAECRSSVQQRKDTSKAQHRRDVKEGRLTFA